MKVQLIVVQGKPEGKVIPLAVPKFRIGRGEGCHLRPNNEQVSRNHSEVEIQDDRVLVRDLGSRNGTFVNNQKVEGDLVVKNGDLLQVGPLTFALSIQGAPEAVAQPPRPVKTGSLDDVSNAEIDAWLVGDSNRPAPERPSGVYTGDTQTLAAYQGSVSKPKSDPKIAPAPKSEPPAPVESPKAARPKVDEPVVFDKLEDEDGNTVGEDAEAGEAAAGMPEEWVDESNPFYAAKKKGPEPVAAAKPDPNKADTSKAAEEVLRKMLERRKANR
jgi:predicted component of type VI protein secretion system